MEKKICLYTGQIATANSCGKLSRQIATTNSHANSCGEFSRQIATANSHGKFPRQILEYVKQQIVWSILCVGSFTREDKKK